MMCKQNNDGLLNIEYIVLVQFASISAQHLLICVLNMLYVYIKPCRDKALIGSPVMVNPVTW